jgi:membrane fusion protein (multidrug efflux system)
MFKRGLHRIYGIGITACVLLAGGCGKGAGGATGSAAAIPAMPVVVESVQKRTVPVMAELVARTTASGTIEIRPNVSGQLLEMSFQEGAPVSKGQVLFRIDPRRYEANVQSAKAALERAEAALELARTQENLVNAQSALKQAEATLQKSTQDVARLRPLAVERAVPERDLDAAVAAENVARAQYESAQATLRTTAVSDRVRIRESEAAVENAKATLIKAELDLDDTVIRSPMNGIIGRSEVTAGNFVNATQTLLATISSVNPINAEFNLPETDYLRLARKRQKGDTASGDIELILSDNSVFPQKGRFTVAERAVEEKTGTIVIQAEFPNPTALIRPGQFARVRFSLENRADALLIPEKALMEIQGAQAVYVVEDGKTAALRSVVTDGVAEGMAIVTSGLKGDERVVVDGQVKIRPGAPVTVVPARND